jgi:hypothetical protein
MPPLNPTILIIQILVKEIQSWFKDIHVVLNTLQKTLFNSLE